jgi:hypothetical protein
MEIKIRKIETERIIRLVLRDIYQWYDMGGISSGRSFSSILLEAAMSIFKFQENWYNEEIPCDGLKAEAERRMKNSERLIKVSFDRRMHNWASASLSFLLLKELNGWLQKCRGVEGRIVTKAEQENISICLGLFKTSDEIPCPPVEELIEEASRRYRIKMDIEKRRLDF